MHRYPNARLGIASLFALLALLCSIDIASAHEHREVSGYTLTVGFMNEPALVNEPNGLSLEVIEGDEDTGTPVEGLADTLQAEVTFGSDSKTVELRGVFGIPGAYTADLIPTSVGPYTFRFFGTIEGTEIDESFTGGPETFSEVESTENIVFPAASVDTDSAAADAQDSAESAKTLAIVGIVIGVLGLVAGAAGVYMAMTARSARTDTASGTTTQPGA